MMWRRNPKLEIVELAFLSRKVWTPKSSHSLPNVSVTRNRNPLIIQELAHISSLKMDTMGPSSCRIFSYRDYKRRLIYLDRVMSLGKFSLQFLDRYNVS